MQDGGRSASANAFSPLIAARRAATDRKGRSKKTSKDTEVFVIMPSDTKRAEKNEMAEIQRTAPTADCEQPDKALLEREGPPIIKEPKPPMDVNLYATKKSVAQGMMDIALLTANASQLKYVLREGDMARFYTLNIVCISLSIALQVIVGILLIVNGRYNINMASHQPRAELMNNFTIIGVFLITVVNVFVSAFGTSH